MQTKARQLKPTALSSCPMYHWAGLLAGMRAGANVLEGNSDGPRKS